MAPQLLPASAAAFAPRATKVNVVFGSKVELWLTEVLKRVCRIKRPLNNVTKHQRCLTELLSSTTAMWTLASLMLPKVPNTKLHRDPNPLIEALLNHYIIHLEAYIVHVDMVLQNEVAFKLSSQTIESLIDYHKNIYSVNLSTDVSPWPEMDALLDGLHMDFIHSVNKFVYRAHVSVLEGLQEDGSGELLGGRSEEVKKNVMNLFRPLISPSVSEEVTYSELTSPKYPLSWPQSSFLTNKLEIQEIGRLVSPCPEIISSTEIKSIWSDIALNDVEQPFLISPFNQQYFEDEVLCSLPQTSNLTGTNAFYSHTTNLEQQSGIDIEHGVKIWDHC